MQLESRRHSQINLRAASARLPRCSYWPFRVKWPPAPVFCVWVSLLDTRGGWLPCPEALPWWSEISSLAASQCLIHLRLAVRIKPNKRPIAGAMTTIPLLPVCTSCRVFLVFWSRTRTLQLSRSFYPRHRSLALRHTTESVSDQS